MLDIKDFSWKGLTKEDKITVIATVVCPIVTLLYFLQAAFVAISFLFIWQHRDSILRKLTQREGLLRNYLQKECHLRNEEEFSMDDRFAVIKETVEKFYQWWMVIWVVWFIYY